MDDQFLLTAAVSMRSLAATDLLSCNEVTARYGLTLSDSEAHELVHAHTAALRDHGRVEFSHGTIRKIAMTFCDSPFISKSNYAEILSDLLDTFYYFKNETLDHLSDDELLTYMKVKFDTDCHGSIELLQHRDLEALARAVRYGYTPNGDAPVEDKESHREGGGRWRAIP